MNIQSPPTAFPDGTRLSPEWQNFFQQLTNICRRDKGTFTTANRPTTGLKVGDHGYDETIAREIWVSSLGPVVWKRADGTTV